MSHTHEYGFWHSHMHLHDAPLKIGHNTGHYHLWAATHDHGDKSHLTPHTHKGKQYHPETDEDNEVHHHAPVDHKPLDYDTVEHHPECKLPYYGGGLKGCIDRCEVGKKKDGK